MLLPNLSRTLSRMALAALLLVSLFAPRLLAQATAGITQVAQSAWGQPSTSADARLPAYDVVSIKPPVTPASLQLSQALLKDGLPIVESTFVGV
jgi:hypothetical protein